MRDFDFKIDNTAPAQSGILSAEVDNVRFKELKNAVATSGIALDDQSGPDSRFNMLAEAQARYASGGIMCRDTGAANAYVLSLSDNFVPPTDFFFGMAVVFYPGNTATGASTINAFGLGIKKFFRPDGSNIQAGDVFSNRLCVAFYDPALDGGAGAFRLAPWCVPVSVSGGVVPQNGEGVSFDNVFHASLNFSGLTQATPLAADLFAFFSVVGQHHRTITLANLIALLQGSVGGLTLANIAPAIMVNEQHPDNATTPTTKNSWVKRPLSNLIVNQISGGSFSSGTRQITLPVGTYRATINSNISNAGNHRARLFNVTSGVEVVTGNSSDSYTGDSAVVTTSMGIGHFTVSATSVFELQVFIVGSHTPYLDDANNNSTGMPQITAWVEIVKEA